MKQRVKGGYYITAESKEMTKGQGHVDCYIIEKQMLNGIRDFFKNPLLMTTIATHTH